MVFLGSASRNTNALVTEQTIDVLAAQMVQKKVEGE